MREMQLNNFTFFGFYERRARRIFPALLADLLFALIGSYSLFLPSDFIYALKGTAGILFPFQILFFGKIQQMAIFRQ